MIRKTFASIIAIIAAATLTLGASLALVEVTVNSISIASLPLRILAVLGDLALGGFLLIGCTWVSTRLAVMILGVGNSEFPPLPQENEDEPPSKN